MALKRVSWRGVTLDERTRNQLVEAEKIGGVYIRPIQGSYSGRVSASAGTHNGSGAVDISTKGMTSTQKNRLVRALRTVGFADWTRPYRAGVWTEHNHGISIASAELSDGAKKQVVEYKNGYDGLAGDGKDPHAWMKVPFRTWEQYLAAKSGLTTIKRPVYGTSGNNVKIYRDRLRKFVAKHEEWYTVQALDKSPVDWDTFNKGLSALTWKAHQVLAEQTGDARWKTLRNDVPGDALLARLGLRAD
jgi:hypothetical protein